MAAHLRNCPNQPKSTIEDDENEKEKKRKLLQTTLAVSTKGVPFSKKEFAEFEKQALYAALDANLSFQWTDSGEVTKLFRMMKPEVRRPRIKIVAGRILDEENRIIV